MIRLKINGNLPGQGCFLLFNCKLKNMKKSGRLGVAIPTRSLLKIVLMMKLAIFITLLTTFQVTATNVNSQNVFLNLQNTEIREVLSNIEKAGKYRFLYNYNLTSLQTKVDFKAENVPVLTALDKLFEGSGLTYQRVSKNLIAILSVNQEENIAVTISGKVISQTGEALPGVSILEKGTSNGTVTNNNGEYTLTVAENATLVVSAIGYESREVIVNSQTVVDITLVAAVAQMEQVVVVGYGSQSRRNITGSVSTISSDDIAERPITNAAQAIQGKAAGVQVIQPSGKPGAGMSVRIRGSNSISGGNDPLYVIDGVPTMDVSSINPTDIESMTILKDASSAAIYGARAANGVVLITTKKGAVSRMKVGLNAYVGLSKPTNMIDVLDGRQYQALINETYGVGTITDEMVQANSVNWPEEVFRTGVEQNYQLSLSGGSNKFKQYYSVGYVGQTGMIKPAEFSRLTGRTNLTFRATDWLTLSTNLSLSHSNSRNVTDNASSARGGVVLSALTTPFTVPEYAADGSIGMNPRSGWENPLGAIEGSRNHSRGNRFLGNLSAEFRIVPGLTFKSLLGLDYNDSYWWNILDPFLTKYGRDQQGTANTNKAYEKALLTEQTLTYAKRAGLHNFSVMGGFTTQDQRYSPNTINVSKFGRDTASKGIDYVIANNRSVPDTSGYPTEWGLISGISRINYEFDNRYLFTGNLRVDASSRFPKDRRTAVFPSFSAGWRISSEEFFKNAANNIQELKLRAGWGMTGNQDGIGPYDYMKRYYRNRTTGDLTLVNFANPSLTWEKTAATNIGLDITFLDSRINASVDWYKKKTTDVLVRMPIPAISGLNAITLNIGDMENKGVEFSMSSKNILQENFRWSTDFNIAFNRNKVLNLGGDPNLQVPSGEIYQRGYASLVKAGYPLGSFYGYVAEGIDPATGNVIYTDFDGNGETNPGDRRFIGNAQPDFIYGLTNNLSYKNFDLSLFFQGSQGNQIFNGARIETEGMYDSRNQTTVVLNRWKQAGDITDVPKAIRNDTYNTYVSSRFVEDGSYLRLKQATLSYRFSNDLIKRIGMSNASLYITGQNILTFTKYTGFDPEVSSYGNDGNYSTKNIAQGIDYGAYPQAKSFIVGLNVTF